jgi:hypothetical protein
LRNNRRHDGSPGVHGNELKRFLAQADFTALVAMASETLKRLVAGCRRRGKGTRDFLGAVQFLTKQQAAACDPQYVYVLYLDDPPGPVELERTPMRVIFGTRRPQSR